VIDKSYGSSWQAVILAALERNRHKVRNLLQDIKLNLLVSFHRKREEAAMESEAQVINLIDVAEKQRNSHQVRTSFSPGCDGKHLEHDTKERQRRNGAILDNRNSRWSNGPC
jgi:hypothetical protein